MTAKEYLDNIRSIERRLKTKESEIDKLQRDIVCLRAIDYSVERISGTKSSDISDKVAKLYGMKAIYDEEWDKLIDLRQEARRYIEQLSDCQQQAVLIERYINVRKTWDDVSKCLNVTERHVHRIHDKAVAAFAEVYYRSKP